MRRAAAAGGAAALPSLGAVVRAIAIAGLLLGVVWLLAQWRQEAGEGVPRIVVPATPALMREAGGPAETPADAAVRELLAPRPLGPAGALAPASQQAAADASPEPQQGCEVIAYRVGSREIRVHRCEDAGTGAALAAPR